MLRKKHTDTDTGTYPKYQRHEHYLFILRREIEREIERKRVRKGKPKRK